MVSIPLKPKIEDQDDIEELSIDLLVAYINKELPQPLLERIRQILKMNPEETLVVEGLKQFQDDSGKIPKSKVDKFLTDSEGYLCEGLDLKRKEKEPESRETPSWLEKKLESIHSREFQKRAPKGDRKKRSNSFLRSRSISPQKKPLQSRKAHASAEDEDPVMNLIMLEQNIIGELGTVVSPLKPMGFIEVRHRKYTARINDGEFAERNETVLVTGRKPGLTQEFEVQKYQKHLMKRVSY